MRFGWGLAFVFLHVLRHSRRSRLYAFGSDLTTQSNFGYDVVELSRSLFSYNGDPLAEVDQWSTLSHELQTKWTASHQLVDRALGIPDVLRATKHLIQSDTRVHIDVQIVAPDFFSIRQKKLIKSYASAMRPSHHGTTLHFQISLAAQSTFKRVSMISSSQSPEMLMKYLEQVASTLGSANILFVVLNSDERIAREHGANMFVGSGKVASMFASIDGANPDLADLLRTVEESAEKLFNPFPLFFPVSVVQDLTVQLIAFTPGRDHNKAQWLEGFAWDQFEANLRGLAVQGQRLRFSSLQVSTECTRCAQAFHGIENPPRDFLRKAVAQLSSDPVETRAGKPNADVPQWRSAERILRLYVVDTYMLHPSNSLERLERWPLSLSRGLAIIMIRSSNKSSITALQVLLARGFLGSSFGVGNPEMYVSQAFGVNDGRTEEEASIIALDISSRNIIRSICEQRVRELEDMARSILYFDVDPATSLGEERYSKFWERLNLLFYKLTEAQKKAGASSELQLALYLALSTQHDMKLLRGSFDIGKDSKTIEKFRDPTLRCQFSRLKRETLRASRIIESRHPNARQTLIASACLIGTMMLWWLIMEQRSRRENQQKSE